MRISRRNLLAAMEQLEIDERDKGPAVSDDVQMVYMLGDTTSGSAFGTGLQALPEPPDDVVVAASVTIGAVAVQEGTIELIVPNTIRGVWASPTFNGGASTFKCWTLAAPQGLASTLDLATASIFGSGRAPLCQMDFGTVVPSDPAGSWDIRIGDDQGHNGVLYPWGIWIAAGRVLVFQRDAGNVLVQVGFIWREVPLVTRTVEP